MQSEPDQVVLSDPIQQGPTDPQELEAFLDGVFAALLEAHHIPGATVAVVKDGELFFTKGYGYADLEKRIPVEPNETLFRPGSVSKLFTGTAVMQLAEREKLDLSEDVNTYLTGFKIPDTYPEPITLEHLMTHTAGFEERNVGIWARTAEDLEPQEEFLTTNMPARVRPPGELAAYSNHGISLAGYIVEKVSGMPFEDYIEENIYTPLDMHHSTFSQPLPLELAPDMAVGYTYENGVYRAEEFEYIQIYPAGSMSATATDMAKFMIAHLQDGRYGNTRILNETTAKEMHRQQFTHDSRINGMCYGFGEQNLNNQLIIEHGGDTIYFHSLLMLLPEQDVGLFVSFNSLGGATARKELKKAFLNRYYPAPDSPEPLPPSDFQQRVKRFTGSYKLTRSPYTTYEKVSSLTGGYPHVSATNDSLLFGGKQYVEVEDLFFRELGGQQTLVFREDSQDRITHMFGFIPAVAFVKLSWYETPVFHYTVLGISMALFLSALVAWPIGALRNRLKAKKKADIPRSRQARWVAGVMSALYVLFLAGIWVIVLSVGESTIIYGYSPLLPFVLLLPLVAAVLTIAALCFTVLAWKNRYWGVAGRVHYTLVMVAALGFIWFLNYWNLLGFRF